MRCKRKNATDFLGKIMMLAVPMGMLLTHVVIKIYKKEDAEFLKERGEKNKFLSYFNTMLLWQKASLDHKKLSDYFQDTESIAVYGMGDIGKLICRSLKENGKNLKYGIDQNSTVADASLGIRVYLPEEVLPQVDVAIISLEYISEQIEAVLKEHEIRKIVTIDEILQSLLGEL